MKILKFNYYALFFFIIVFSSASCRSQSILKKNRDRVLYTLKMYEYCLFYSKDLSESEGVNMEALQCVLPYDGRYFIGESKELLFEVVQKKYSKVFIKKIAKKETIYSFRSQLNKAVKVLKDSAINGRFLTKKMYRNVIIKRNNLKKLLSNNQIDTLPKFISELKKKSKKLEKYKISNGLIYALAFIDDDRSVPTLENFLTDTLHVNNNAVKLSLAKLKIEPYYRNQLNKLKEEVNHIILDKDGGSNVNVLYAYPRAGLLQTNEAINIYSKALQAKYFDTIDHGDVSESSIPIRTIVHLLELIENKEFVEYFKDNYGYIKGVDELREKDVKWAIKWVENNKETIQINKNHIPLLHNDF